MTARSMLGYMAGCSYTYTAEGQLSQTPTASSSGLVTISGINTIGLVSTWPPPLLLMMIMPCPATRAALLHLHAAEGPGHVWVASRWHSCVHHQHYGAYLQQQLACRQCFACESTPEFLA